jgi:hypothetical protein
MAAGLPNGIHLDPFSVGFAVGALGQDQPRCHIDQPAGLAASPLGLLVSTRPSNKAAGKIPRGFGSFKRTS